jgi:hypothetical protein
MVGDGLLINYIAGIPDKMIELIQALPNTFRLAQCEIGKRLRLSRRFRGRQRACKYLLGMGHRRIAYVDYWMPTITAWQIAATVICAQCVRRD